MVLRPLPVVALAAALLLVGVATAERFSGSLLEGSRVRYDAAAGWETWQGVAPARVERLTFDDADLATLRLEVRVAADDFASGNVFRDRNARRVVFETDEHPDIAFVLQRARPADGEASMTLPDGAERALSLSGTLDLHGVRREVEVPVTVRRTGDRLAVTGGFEVRLSDYAMTAPSIFGRGVEDLVTVRFDLVVALAPA
jgi:polyisoprenoid-binding protein YceI